MSEARRWIDGLRLRPHPEGGYYRETYRASEGIARAALPARFPGDRSFCTAIYYLLEAGQLSAFHRIRQDEMWHLYAGGGLTVHVIDPTGRYDALKLGADLGAGTRPAP